MTSLLLVAASFAVALGLNGWFSNPRLGRALIRVAGDLSLRGVPVPRVGGVAILTALGVTVPFSLVGQTPLPGLGYVVVGTLAVAAVSLWDDVFKSPILARLAVHFLAAGAMLWGGFTVHTVIVPGLGPFDLGAAGHVLTLLFIVWFANLYNFMDGIDGIAGGMGALGFTFLAWVSWRGGHEQLALFALLVAAANAGFLAFNFPPAKVFLGDVGSVPMGLLASAFSLWGAREGAFGLWVPGLVFSPFIVDATVTMLRRALNREKVWRAHRSHFYQRALRLGWGQRNTVLGEYALMLGGGCTAVVLHTMQSDALTLAGVVAWAAVYAVLAIVITRQEHRQRDQRHAGKA